MMAGRSPVVEAPVVKAPVVKAPVKKKVAKRKTTKKSDQKKKIGRFASSLFNHPALQVRNCSQPIGKLMPVITVH